MEETLLHKLQSTESRSRYLQIPDCYKHSNGRFDVQRAKKVLSDSPGLVDFAIGLVNSVFNLPDRQVMFYEEFE